MTDEHADQITSGAVVHASPWRLLSTLAGAGAMAGLLIVVVYQWAAPRIEAHQAAVLREAVQEVLADPARYDTLYVVGAAITGSIPVDADPRGFEKVYLGYDDAGTPVGFAIPGAEPGFQDLIRLLFGYDPRSNRVIGMRILESKETPGLGDKIEKDAAFVAAFERVTAPIQGVKVGRGQGDEHEIDMITGATISSRTVIAIINHRLEALGPLLDAYIAERRR